MQLFVNYIINYLNH